MSELSYESLLGVSALIKSRAVSSVAVTEHMLDRILRQDGTYKSYMHVSSGHALMRAREADVDMGSGAWRGPLHGVPIAVKDLCYTTFAPTSGGMRMNASFMAPFNATVVDRLEDAGAVILGKLSLTEGAYTAHHPMIPAPVNPWHPDHWVGASSSGSGVATAAGLCFGSLGSDTGGSIRFPSAACGLTGIKPTWGRVSRHGVFALADSLDHVGPMARNALDAAAMLRAIAGWDADDPTTLRDDVPDYVASATEGLRGLRIGIDEDYAFVGVEPEVVAALESAIEVLASLGAEVVKVSVPEWSTLVSKWIMMCSVETAIAHLDEYPSRRSEFGPELARHVEQGRGVSGIEYVLAHHERLKFTGALAALFHDVDLLAIPTMPSRVPTLEQVEAFAMDPGFMTSTIRYAAPFDLSGNPTITFPNGVDALGLPLSMQLVAPRLGEDVLVRAAHAFQRATDWHARHPPD